MKRKLAVLIAVILLISVNINAEPGDVFVEGKLGVGTTALTPGAKVEVNGHIHGMPVVGRWQATNNGIPNVNYVWGIEIFNTDNSYLTRSADSQSIVVNISGYYLITVNALQSFASTCNGCRSDVFLLKNGVGVGFSLGYAPPQDVYVKHNLSEIIYCASGDNISVYSATANTYAQGDAWTTLNIYRLN